MANVVTSQTIHDGGRTLVMKFTNISDGSAEVAVKKVDVSTLSGHPTTGTACTSVDIRRVLYTTSGISVDILWDATANVAAWTVHGNGHLDFRSMGPISNNAGDGVTGDILFTVVGPSSGDRYSILLEMSKNYA